MTIVSHGGGISQVVVWGDRAYLAGGPDAETVWVSQTGLSWASRLRKGVVIPSFRVDAISVNPPRYLAGQLVGLYHYRDQEVLGVVEVLRDFHPNPKLDVTVRALTHIEPFFSPEPVVERDYGDLGKVTLPAFVADLVPPMHWLAATLPVVPGGAYRAGRFALTWKEEEGWWHGHHSYWGHSLREFYISRNEEVPHRYRGELCVEGNAVVLRHYGMPKYTVLVHAEGQHHAVGCHLVPTKPWRKQLARFRRGLADWGLLDQRRVEQFVDWIAADLGGSIGELPEVAETESAPEPIPSA